MKLKFFYTALLWLICSVVALAQSDSTLTKNCAFKFFKDKPCHIIDITYNEESNLPYYRHGELKEIPFGVPVYLKITGDSKLTFKVKIDTVFAKEVNPLDSMAPFKEKHQTESAIQTKKNKKSTHHFFHLGSFDQGNQINFTIFVEEKTNTKKKKITTTTLDEEFLKKTLQKGEENHKDVNLLDILKEESHPNSEFLVKLKIEEENLTFIDKGTDPYKTLSEKSQTTWKDYSEIFSMYHHGVPDTTVTKSEDVAGWESLAQFSFHVPKRYRFRIRAGISIVKIDDTNVSIQSRKANAGDLDGIDSNNLPLGFRSSQFITDTTNVYRIQTSESEINEFSPTLFLSIYPFSRKSLSSDYSLLGTLFKFNNRWSWNVLTQSISVHLGTSITKDAFKNYSLGGSIELLEGLDFGVSYYSYETKKLAAPFDYQDKSLNGTQPFFTNGNVPEAASFLKSKRSASISYSLSVDAIIFQKAFATIFSTIKKGITGS